MKLWITGLNHKTAPVSVRERLAFPENELPRALRDLQSRPGLAEGMILSTCNRVEVAVAAEDAINPQDSIEEFLASTQQVQAPGWLRPYVYQFEGREAIRHLFRVASSLDSMVIGEPQILGQLKSAYSVAKSEGAVKSFLDAVVTRAFNVAKRVRSETEIGASAVSISYAAVELAREIFGSLSNTKVMLIGAGKMSELAARHLLRSGVAQTLVTNRTRQRADEVAELVGGKVIEYESFPSHLTGVDIVITSSGAPEPILRKQQVRKIIEARKNRPMFLIDIAVPRNIEPEVNELDNVFLYDIDDLQRVVDNNLRGRMDEAAEADRIVTEEVERLETWLRSRQVVPLIVSLQDQFEQVRAAETAKLKSKLGPLTPQQEDAIEMATRAMINKLAHGPITELRTSTESPSGSTVLEAIRRMFRL